MPSTIYLREPDASECSYSRYDYAPGESSLTGPNYEEEWTCWRLYRLSEDEIVRGIADSDLAELKEHMAGQLAYESGRLPGTHDHDQYVLMLYPFTACGDVFLRVRLELA